MAASIATARPGAKVIGVGATDVRSFDSLKAAVDRCVKELGGIDFVMYGNPVMIVTAGRWDGLVTDRGTVPVLRVISLHRSTSYRSMPSSR